MLEWGALAAPNSNAFATYARSARTAMQTTFGELRTQRYRAWLQVDNFIITSGNIGAIQKIKIRSSGSGLGAAWHLNKIEVQSTATGEKLVFPFGKWVDEKNGLEHVLWPDRDGDGIPDPTADADLLKYKVSVYTSDIRCVWLKICSSPR